jgi:hypothetical protein
VLGRLQFGPTVIQHILDAVVQVLTHYMANRIKNALCNKDYVYLRNQSGYPFL